MVCSLASRLFALATCRTTARDWSARLSAALPFYGTLAAAAMFAAMIL